MRDDIKFDNLKNLNDDDLAFVEYDLHEGESPLPARIRQEWRRRELLNQHNLNLSVLQQQHELNKEIQSKQSKLTVISLTITAIATIVAALVGAYVGSYWQAKIQDKQKEELVQVLKDIGRELSSTKASYSHKKTTQQMNQKEPTLKSSASSSHMLQTKEE